MFQGSEDAARTRPLQAERLLIAAGQISAAASRYHSCTPASARGLGGVAVCSERPRQRLGPGTGTRRRSVSASRKTGPTSDPYLRRPTSGVTQAERRVCLMTLRAGPRFNELNSCGRVEVEVGGGFTNNDLCSSEMVRFQLLSKLRIRSGNQTGPSTAWSRSRFLPVQRQPQHRGGGADPAGPLWPLPPSWRSKWRTEGCSKSTRVECQREEKHRQDKHLSL